MNKHNHKCDFIDCPSRKKEDANIAKCYIQMVYPHCLTNISIVEQKAYVCILHYFLLDSAHKLVHVYSLDDYNTWQKPFDSNEEWLPIYKEAA